MKPEFKLIDFVQIAPDKGLCNLSKKDKVKFIDSILDPRGQEADRKRGLSVDWHLSHSGRRINNRIYTVKGQKEGIDSILSPYPKPVLQNHDSSNDPIGRFTGGYWESLYSDAIGFFSNLSDFMAVQDAFEKDDPKRIYKVMKKYDLLTNKAWPGLGRMSVSARITDQVAIEKFLDGRYITFSAGSTTDRHVCSICNSDWATGDYCDHRHGKIYDGDVCVFITGKFEVLEGSVVNMPADDLSQVQSMEVLDSSDLNLKFKKIDTDHFNVDPTTIYVTDSTYNMERDMAEETVQVNEEPVEETPVEVESKDEAVETEVAESQEDTSETVEEIVEAAPVMEGDLDDDIDENLDSETSESVDAEDKLLEKLIAKLQERGITVANVDKLREATNVESDSETGTEVNALQEGDIQSDSQTEAKEEENKDEASNGAIEEGVHQEEMVDELPNTDDVDWYLLGAALDFELGDAKLSAEERKKLPASAFCGPERSFPVPDCAHVTAARRLIGRAKLSASQKERVLACVSRKANSMSCDTEDTQLNELKKDYSEALKRIQMLEGKLEEAIDTIALYKKDNISFEKDDNKLEVLLSYFDNMTNVKDIEPEATVVVEDPSVSSSDESSKTDATRKGLGAFEQNILTTYSRILDKDGLGAAEKFFRSKRRYLPRGFHPSKL